MPPRMFSTENAAGRPSIRFGQGIAKAMMVWVERKLRALGCPKINLQIRRTNTAVIHFYQAVGFDEDDVISFGKRLA